MPDKVLNGAAILPLATSAIGLPSLAAWAASLASNGKTMSTGRSIDCSKSLRLISSAPPDGHALATTTTLVCGAFDLSQARIADGVARRRQRQLGDDHRDMGIVHQVRILDQHVPRQVEHRRFEGVAHLFLKLEEGGAVGHQRLVDRRFRRQHRQALVGADHRAFDEQAVDAARVLDRIGEAAARLEVERQGAGAEMDVEVEQRGAAVRLLAQQPGQRGRDGRSTDAAANADDGGHDVRLVGLRFAARAGQDRLGMGEGVAQLVDRERLEQIIVDAAGDEVAVQADVVDRAGGDHDRARLADLGERVDVVERIGGFAQVHEQDVRAGRNRQRLDRVAKAALVDLLRRPAVLDRDRPKHVRGRIVADECGERIAQTRACLERSVHYLPPSY